MAKKVTGYIKLQIPAGKATPAPPVGPALGQHGVNIVQFTKEFNARTADKGGMIIPVVITVYQDRTFSFITKTPPAAVLLKKYCNIKSGSGVPNKTKVASISKDKIKEIAEIKMPDLNAYDQEAAINIVAGTARNMGVAIKGLNDSELAEHAKEAAEAEAQAAKLEEALEEMEESAKAMAEGASVEVESTEQSKEDEEKANEE